MKNLGFHVGVGKPTTPTRSSIALNDLRSGALMENLGFCTGVGKPPTPYSIFNNTK